MSFSNMTKLVFDRRIYPLLTSSLDNYYFNSRDLTDPKLLYHISSSVPQFKFFLDHWKLLHTASKYLDITEEDYNFFIMCVLRKYRIDAGEFSTYVDNLYTKILSKEFPQASIVKKYFERYTCYPDQEFHNEENRNHPENMFARTPNISLDASWHLTIPNIIYDCWLLGFLVYAAHSKYAHINSFSPYSPVDPGPQRNDGDFSNLFTDFITNKIVNSHEALEALRKMLVLEGQRICCILSLYAPELLMFLSSNEVLDKYSDSYGLGSVYPMYTLFKLDKVRRFDSSIDSKNTSDFRILSSIEGSANNIRLNLLQSNSHLDSCVDCISNVSKDLMFITNNVIRILKTSPKEFFKTCVPDGKHNCDANTFNEIFKNLDQVAANAFVTADRDYVSENNLIKFDTDLVPVPEDTAIGVMSFRYGDSSYRHLFNASLGDKFIIQMLVSSQMFNKMSSPSYRQLTTVSRIHDFGKQKETKPKKQQSQEQHEQQEQQENRQLHNGHFNGETMVNELGHIMCYVVRTIHRRDGTDVTTGVWYDTGRLNGPVHTDGLAETTGEVDGHTNNPYERVTTTMQVVDDAPIRPVIVNTQLRQDFRTAEADTNLDGLAEVAREETLRAVADHVTDALNRAIGVTEVDAIEEHRVEEFVGEEERLETTEHRLINGRYYIVEHNPDGTSRVRLE